MTASFNWDDYDAEPLESPQAVEVNPEKPKRLPPGTPPLKQSPIQNVSPPISNEIPSSEFDWGDVEPEPQEAKEDSLIGSIVRYLWQAPAGAIQAATIPLDLAKMQGEGEALSDLWDLEDRWPELQENFPGMNDISLPEFKQRYLEALDQSTKYYPTLTNYEEFAEEKTGVPLIPKNRIQKLIRLGGMAATLQPGSLVTRTGAGIGTPLLSEVYKSAGAPEALADTAAFLLPRATGASLAKVPKSEKELVSGLVGDVPLSTYEEAEKTLRNIEQIPTGERRLPIGQERTQPGRLEPSRIQQQAPDRQLPTITSQGPRALKDEVGEIFSRNRFRNPSEGGVAMVSEIRNLDEQAYRGVTELYNRSRALNENITTIHPQLAENLHNRIAELQRIPHPSDIQNRLLRAMQNIEGNLVVRGPNGEVNGFLPINNQALIDQVQSLRQIIDYDFAHGGAKNIFRPVINDIQESALNAAEQTGNLEAVVANREARTAYRDWATTFDNDYIRPFRDTSNHDYSKMFKKSLDPDEFNQITHILGISERGRIVNGGVQRELVSEKLNKFLEDPRKAKISEFNKALEELEAVITPEQSNQIRQAFNRARAAPPFRAQRVTPAETVASKYLGKDPEFIQDKMKTRSGIKELRRDLVTNGTNSTRQNFNNLTKQKTRSILQEGEITKEFTGNDLYKLLNKENNFEILSEIIGQEATENARQIAKEIGKKKMRKELIIKGAKKAVGKAGAVKFLETIWPLVL